MKHTMSVLVENRAGVLSRISGLFSRRGFNIDSLTVGTTDDRTISRMTIVVDCNEYTVEQMEKQLNKLIDVLKVKELSADETTRRELALIKVGITAQARGEVIDIARVMNAKIVDISHTTLTVEICDRPERVDLAVELLSSYKIQELARTGAVALEKGSGTIGYKEKNGEAKKPAGEGI